MLKNRHFISYFGTSLLYLLMVVLFFYSQDSIVVAEKTIIEKNFKMQLSSFIPEVTPPIEETIEKEEPKEESIQKQEAPTKQEPIQKEQEAPIEEKTPPKEIPPLEPVIEKVIPKPLPVVEKTIVKKPKPKQTKIKNPVEKKRTKKQKITKKVKKRTKKKVSHKASSQQRKKSKAEKNRFLAKIRANINRYKSYPKMAKRRHMQGSVEVSFTILSNGKVSNISLKGAKIFYASAKQAIMKAFPIDSKHAPVHLPVTLNLRLVYQIR